MLKLAKLKKHLKKHWKSFISRLRGRQTSPWQATAESLTTIKSSNDFIKQYNNSFEAHITTYDRYNIGDIILINPVGAHNKRRTTWITEVKDICFSCLPDGSKRHSGYIVNGFVEEIIIQEAQAAPKELVMEYKLAGGSCHPVEHGIIQYPSPEFIRKLEIGLSK